MVARLSEAARSRSWTLQLVVRIMSARVGPKPSALTRSSPRVCRVAVHWARKNGVVPLRVAMIVTATRAFQRADMALSIMATANTSQRIFQEADNTGVRDAARQNAPTMIATTPQGAQ